MDKLIRVLIAEDSEDDALLMMREMKRAGYDPIFERVDSADAMTVALTEQTWDLILSDHTMPQFDSFAALRVLQKAGLDLPFIIVSGKIGEEMAVAAMKAGAGDYILKGNLARLVPAIERELREAEGRRERKRTEEALRKSEQRYRALAESAEDFIFILDKNGSIQYVNRFGAKEFGYSQEEIIGKNMKEMFPPPVSERQWSNLQKVIESGKPFNIEQPTRFPNRELWLNTSLIPLKNEGGEVTSILGISRDITEHRRTEDEIRKLNQFLEVIIDNANVWLNVLDDQANVLIWNKAAETISGYSRGEVIGHDKVWEWLYPEEKYRREILERVAAVIKKGEISEGLETITRTKSGDERVISWYSRNLLNEKGVPMGSIALGRDVTEGKRSEKALRESEERFKELYDRAPVGYHEYDLEGRIIRVNRTDLEMLGYTQEEMIGQSVWKFSVEEKTAREGVLAKLEGTLPPSKELEGTYRRKDGTTLPVLIQDRLIQDEKGRIKGIRCTIEDITERKRTEEALKESEETLRVFLNANLDTALLIDSRGTVLIGNESLSKRLDKRFDEIIGFCLYDLLPEELARQRKSYFDEVIRTGKPVRFEDTRMGRNYETFAYPVLDREGNAIKVAILGFDITERKQMEEKMVRLQEQFRQAQKMEAIGRLAGGIAHDFNNLLTIINGYSQLSLQDLKKEDPLRGNIEEIQDAGKRAATLTRQLLAFSRRQVMEMKVIDINMLLKDIEKMLRRILGEDVELITFLAEDLGRVKADPGQIEQVIMNLAVNARDAMPSGGKLTVETVNVELDEAYARAHGAVTPGHYVMLSVSDSGVGMTPEIRDRVFEPFFTTKEKGKGTGLGLSTVYGIVKQSGGNIWVYSEPGQGSIIKIYLPKVDLFPATLEKKVVKENPPLGSETILVVEDDGEVRKLAVRILRKQGYVVLEAGQGDEGFHVCKQHQGPIHLMMTDVVMPGMGGHELAKRLEPLHPNMKVLYMSGYTDNAIVHHGVLDEGMSYIQKPFTVDGLARKVREVLDE